MKTDNELYIDDFNCWLKESETRLEKLKNDIEYSNKTIALQHESISLTKKQYEIHVERMNLAIKDHNDWARDKGIEETKLFENDLEI